MSHFYKIIDGTNVWISELLTPFVSYKVDHVASVISIIEESLLRFHLKMADDCDEKSQVKRTKRQTNQAELTNKLPTYNSIREISENERCKQAIIDLIRLYWMENDLETVTGLLELCGNDKDLLNATNNQLKSEWARAFEEYGKSAEKSCFKDRLWHNEIVLSGQMQCLSKLGDWSQLAEISQSIVDASTSQPLSLPIDNHAIANLVLGNEQMSSLLSNEALKMLILAKSILIISDKNEPETSDDKLDALLSRLESGIGVDFTVGIPLTTGFHRRGRHGHASTLLSHSRRHLLQTIGIKPTVGNLDRLKIVDELNEIVVGINTGGRCRIFESHSDISHWNFSAILKETFDYPSAAFFNIFSLKRIRALTKQGAFEQALAGLEKFKRNQLMEKEELEETFNYRFGSVHLSGIRVVQLLFAQAQEFVKVLPQVTSVIEKQRKKMKKSSKFDQLLVKALEDVQLLKGQTVRQDLLNKLVDLVGESCQNYKEICEKVLSPKKSLIENLENSRSLLRYAIELSENGKGTALNMALKSYLKNLNKDTGILTGKSTCLYLAPVISLITSEFLHDVGKIIEEEVPKLIEKCESYVFIPFLEYLEENQNPTSIALLENFIKHHTEEAIYCLTNIPDTFEATDTRQFVENLVNFVAPTETGAFPLLPSPLANCSMFRLPWLKNRILKIEPNAIVIDSLTKPFKLKLLVENGKMVEMLVKRDGTGLIRENQAQCLLRNLYHCIEPTTTQQYQFQTIRNNKAIVEWISEAKTLESIVTANVGQLAMNKVKLQSDEIAMEITQGHNFEALLKNLTSDMLDKVNQCQRRRENLLPMNALRNQLLLSSFDSNEAHRRRMKLLDSYALLSTVTYLLGIGDRHPKNVLINLQNFQFVHCDLSHCYGLAVSNQTVPELVPFRMTAQLQSLFWPNLQGRFKFELAKHLRSLVDQRNDVSFAIGRTLRIFLHTNGFHYDQASLKYLFTNAVSDRLLISPTEVILKLLPLKCLWRNLLFAIEKGSNLSFCDALGSPQTKRVGEAGSLDSTLPISEASITVVGENASTDHNRCDVLPDDLIAEKLLHLSINEMLMFFTHSGWKSFL